jgi:hypothetical protein
MPQGKLTVRIGDKVPPGEGLALLQGLVMCVLPASV